MRRVWSSDQVAATADQQPDLGIDLGRGVDRAQIGAHPQLLARSGIDRADPVELLGDVHPHRDRHDAPSRGIDRAPAPRAVLALHSDGSQSLISGLEGAGETGGPAS